jgi:antitoxin component YwqK of YwqJK toxin-antitoxin module
LGAALLLALLLLAAPAPAADPGELDCPRGTKAKGGSPPRARKQWCALPDGTQHGPSIRYYGSGKVMVRAEFAKGEMSGPYRAWHKNGQLAESGVYVRDKRDGPFRTFDGDGTVLTEESYKRGKVHGRSRIWFLNGQLMVDAVFANGTRNGPAVTYYDNGNKRTEGGFRSNRHHGEWRGWYEDGSLAKVAEFEDGRELSREEFPRGSPSD